MIGVFVDLIDKYGVVSEFVVCVMVEGVLCNSCV